MTALATALISAALIAATPAAAPAERPPAIAQICAATGIDQVDTLLADLAATDLVGDLAPLLTLTVPDRDSVELDASVQLDDVRQALNCDAVDDDGEPVDPGDDELPEDTDDGFTQIDDLPTGAADTGGGPAA